VRGSRIARCCASCWCDECCELLLREAIFHKIFQVMKFSDVLACIVVKVQIIWGVEILHVMRLYVYIHIYI
jgi:hypothetical protein